MTATETDVGIGLAALLGLSAVGAAAYTLFAPTQELTAYGFAAAITLSVLLIAALHLYE